MSRSESPDLLRCQREIEHAKALLLAGHNDIEGLLACIRDWAAEARLISQEHAQ